MVATPHNAAVPPLALKYFCPRVWLNQSFNDWFGGDWFGEIGLILYDCLDMSLNMWRTIHLRLRLMEPQSI